MSFTTRRRRPSALRPSSIECGKCVEVEVEVDMSTRANIFHDIKNDGICTIWCTWMCRYNYNVIYQYKSTTTTNTHTHTHTLVVGSINASREITVSTVHLALWKYWRKTAIITVALMLTRGSMRENYIYCFQYSNLIPDWRKCPNTLTATVARPVRSIWLSLTLARSVPFARHMSIL